MSDRSFAARVYEYMDNLDMIKDGERVIIGLSGGADSVALLSLLDDLRAKRGLSLFAVHINHMMRGTEADEDELFCHTLCEKLGLDFHSERINIREFAESERITLEEAGRLVRYIVFESARMRHNGDKIAVAHNKNDNAETVLQRIVRGTGSKGLCGIPPVRDKIVRPLLNFTRAEIEDYLAEKGMVFRTDSTNLKNDYTRNKIRNTLLPYIEKEFNPQAVDAITRLSGLLYEQEEFIDLAANETFLRLSSKNTLALSGLLVLSGFMQKRVIRLAVQKEANMLKDVSMLHIENIQKLIHAQTGSSTTLPHGLIVKKSYSALVFDKEPVKTTDICYELMLEERKFIPELCSHLLVSEHDLENNHDLLYTKVFYCDKIFDIFELRSRRPGDMFSKKLSDFMIDIKLERDERERALLLCSGNSVLLFFANDKLHENRKLQQNDQSLKPIFVHIFRG